MHLRVPLAGAYPCGDFLPGYRSPCASHGDFKLKTCMYSEGSERISKRNILSFPPLVSGKALVIISQSLDDIHT